MANLVKTFKESSLDNLEGIIQDFFNKNKEIEVISMNYDTIITKSAKWSNGTMESQTKEYSVVIVYKKEPNDIIFG